MSTWTAIETSFDVQTAFAVVDGQPRVSTVWGDVDLSGPVLEDYRDDVMIAIDAQRNLWCADSDRADQGERDGEEVWYPRVLDVQPTHVLTINGKREASVLPVGDGCEPCELDANSGLSTRTEWLCGESPSYSLVNGGLCCHGEPVFDAWSLDPIER